MKRQLNDKDVEKVTGGFEIGGVEYTYERHLADDFDSNYPEAGYAFVYADGVLVGTLNYHNDETFYDVWNQFLDVRINDQQMKDGWR